MFLKPASSGKPLNIFKILDMKWVTLKLKSNLCTDFPFLNMIITLPKIFSDYD